jgi:hypothetical protein
LTAARQAQPRKKDNAMEANGQNVDGLGLLGEPIEAVLGAGKGAGVDLAGWARGEKEYRFSDVQKAIDDYILGEIYKIVDARFVSVKGRRDAVQFLIDEGIIDAGEARDDVM